MTPTPGATGKDTIDICFVDEEADHTPEYLHRGLVERNDGNHYHVHQVAFADDLAEPLRPDLLLIEPFPFLAKYVTNEHLQHPLYQLIMQRHEAKRPVILMTTQPITLIARCGLHLGQHYAGFVQKWCIPWEDLVPEVVEVLGLDTKQEQNQA